MLRAQAKALIFKSRLVERQHPIACSYATKNLIQGAGDNSFTSKLILKISKLVGMTEFPGGTSFVLGLVTKASEVASDKIFRNLRQHLAVAISSQSDVGENVDLMLKSYRQQLNQYGFSRNTDLWLAYLEFLTVQRPSEVAGEYNRALVALRNETKSTGFSLTKSGGDMQRLVTEFAKLQNRS